MPFDARVYSWQVGTRKPEPQIYQMALDELSVAAKDAVFVDDFEAMVDGARAIGMHGIHFTDSADAITQIRTLLK